MLQAERHSSSFVARRFENCGDLRQVDQAAPLGSAPLRCCIGELRFSEDEAYNPCCLTHAVTKRPRKRSPHAAPCDESVHAPAVPRRRASMFPLTFGAPCSSATSRGGESTERKPHVVAVPSGLTMRPPYTSPFDSSIAIRSITDNDGGAFQSCASRCFAGIACAPGCGGRAVVSRLHSRIPRRRKTDTCSTTLG